MDAVNNIAKAFVEAAKKVNFKRPIVRCTLRGGVGISRDLGHIDDIIDQSLMFSKLGEIAPQEIPLDYLFAISILEEDDVVKELSREIKKGAKGKNLLWEIKTKLEDEIHQI